MFASLHRVDREIASENGQRRFVQTDHRDTDEILASRELSVVFALSRVLGPRHIEGREAQVIYFLQNPPPEFLIEAVVAAGGLVYVGTPPSGFDDVTGSLRKPPRPVEVILNEAMSALARRTAAEKGLPLDWDALGRFERQLLATWEEEDETAIDVDFDAPEDEQEEQEEEDQEKDPEDEDGGVARWTAFVQLASFAGELLRVSANGRWVVKTDSESLLPLFHESSAGNKSLVTNLIGKAVKLRKNGIEDSVRFLGQTILTMLGQQAVDR